MFYAERFSNPTRALSPRQLPTDHVHAVPTREYQSDQSSRLLLRCHRSCCPKRIPHARQQEHSAVSHTGQNKRPVSLPWRKAGLNYPEPSKSN